MKIVNGHCIYVDTSDDDLPHGAAKYETESVDDPLKGTNTEVSSPKFYRLDSVVFAEPISSCLLAENNLDTGDIQKQRNEHQDSEMTFIDNVVVHKRPGKRNKKYHIDLKDPNNPTCPQPNCNRRFSTTVLLKAHVRKVHCSDRNRFICDCCGATFPARYLLQRHRRCHFASRQRCDVCQRDFSAGSDLKVHLRSHSAVRPFECEV